MKLSSVLLLVSMLASTAGSAQQVNPLLTMNFWQNKPSLDDVKKQIAEGSNPSELNPASFDAVTMAINTQASNAIILHLLAQDGNPVTKKTHHSRSYLHWAAARGNSEIVDHLIQEGSAVDYADSHGTTIAAFAASSGNKNIAVYESLFKAGVAPQQKYADGMTLLMLIAAVDEDLTLTDYFVSKGLDIHEKDDQGRTVADYAARSGNTQLVEKFMHKDITLTDQALLLAAIGTPQAGSNLDFFRYLVDTKGLNPQVVGPDGNTVFHYLVWRPNLAIFQYFIEKGADVRKADSEGNTALHTATAGQQTELVALLLDSGADVNARNNNGETALSRAIMYGSAPIAKLLLERGADIHTKDNEGNNLAYYWFNSYRKPMPNMPNAELYAQAFNEKLALLQANGLDVSAAQQHGYTLFHLAVQKENPVLISKAAELGADINAKDKDGNTALHRASLTAKDDHILKLLLELGANKQIQTELGETAYDLAIENDFLKSKSIAVDFLK